MFFVYMLRWWRGWKYYITAEHSSKEPEEMLDRRNQELDRTHRMESWQKVPGSLADLCRSIHQVAQPLLFHFHARGRRAGAKA